MTHNFTCQNCGAEFPAEQPPRDHNGRIICCAHCMFNPEGCRCKWGDYGQPETYRDDGYPDVWGDAGDFDGEEGFTADDYLDDAHLDELREWQDDDEGADES